MPAIYPTPRRQSGGVTMRPANDNYRPPVGRPANDNRPGMGLAMSRTLSRALFRDARLQLLSQGFALLADAVLKPGELVIPQDDIPAGLDLTGWNVKHNFGRTPNFNVAGGPDYRRAWPNITKSTNFNYPFSLAGYAAPNGWQTAVPEFFLDPSGNEFSVWKFHQYETYSGNKYTRLSSALTYIRAGAVGFPVYQPVALPQPALRPLPLPVPWTRTQAVKLPKLDIWGHVLRGPLPYPKPHVARKDLPAPPPKHTKESKYSGFIGTLFRISEQFSEFKDATDAIYEALPAWLRKQLGLKKGYGDLERKWSAIYTYFQYLDGRKVVENLLIEGQKDRYAGRIYGAISKARRSLGVVTGPAIHGGPRT